MKSFAVAGVRLSSLRLVVRIGGASLALLSTWGGAHAGSVLDVGIQTDLPPYVMHGATDGLEVQIVRDALAGHSVRFVQMPYAQLQTAVPDKRVGVAVAVKQLSPADEGVFYSREFITFANAAITKKSAGLEIDDVADLARHPVLAWQDAAFELGPAFERLYAPSGSERARYTEFGDQVEQVRAFWAAPDAVAVIDQAVFRWFTKDLGHAMDEVVAHPIFPPVTSFRVAFADAALRDAFDRGIAQLCASGDYAKLLARWDVVLVRTVCDG